MSDQPKKPQTWQEKRDAKVAELRAQLDAGTYIAPPQPAAPQALAPRPKPQRRPKKPKDLEVSLVARKIRLQDDEDSIAAADRRLNKLTPLAVRVLEHEMRTGNSQARFAAAKQVLESRGLGKKENGTQATAPIIILQGTAVQSPPWAKKPAIEGTVTAVVDTKAKDEDT